MDTRKVYEALRVSQVRIHPIIVQFYYTLGVSLNSRSSG